MNLKSKANFLLFFGLLSIFLLEQSNADASGIKCTIDDDNYCIFLDVETNKSHPKFYPTADNPKEVIKIKFENSTTPIFTSELCEAFPNLEELHADTMKIEKLMPEAFEKCEELTYISLYTNEIQEIPVDFFKHNLKLLEIILQSNELREFNPKIIAHLNKLTDLNLMENLLSDLHLTEFPYLRYLETLLISENVLTDLDVDEIIKKFPKLQKIYMNGNPIDCHKLLGILSTFKMTNIAVKNWANETESEPTKPSYDPVIIDDIDCFLKGKSETNHLQKYLEGAHLEVSVDDITIVDSH